MLSQVDGNIFDWLTVLTPPKPSNLRSELDCYLSNDVENAADALAWWDEKQAIYPQLSRMARDYLSIPGKDHINLFML